jgi:hypothetical protein
VESLKPGYDRDFLPFLEALDEFRPVQIEDARSRMSIGRQNRQLPPLPGPCIYAHPFEHDREKTSGYLLARGHHGIVFPRVMQDRPLPAPRHELIGHARHGGDHDRHLMARTHLAFDMPRDVADALHIGNGGAAELHHQPGHNSLRAPWVECRGAFERAPAQKGAYT